MTYIKTILSGIFFTGCLCMNAQQPVKITGTIEGISSGRLLLIVPTAENKQDTIASTDFSSPNFTLEANLKEVTGAQIVLDKYAGGFFFFAEPGKEYKAHLVNGPQAEIKSTTTSIQNEWDTYLNKIKEFGNKCDSLQTIFEGFKKESKFRSASEANKKIEAYKKEGQAEIKNYLQSHNPVIAAYVNYSYAAQQTLDATGSKQQYDALTADAQKTIYGRMLAERVSRLEAATSGKPAPDFTLNDPQGNPITFSKVKGKLKIVDFWASWCGPCRLNNPKVKEIYNEFKDKGLEIIGVSLDTDAKRWKEAIEKDGLPWIHVSSLQGWKCPVASSYGVSMVPALFVIDSNNKIITTGLKGDELKNFIAKYLNK